MPEIVTAVPAVTVAPAAGDTMVEAGATLSAVAVAGNRPAISVAGWAFMSAKMFTVACCMLGSGAALPRS